MTRQFQINPRTISSSFLEPLPSHLQAQLVVSRLSMPRPPRSIGRCTFSQATKQQSPLACFLPFQRNPFLNLLINLINHLGTLIATRRYTGIAESTYLTRVARPALFMRAAFQLGSLSVIFSTQGIKAALLSFLFEIGRPK